jgi:thioesterase domain-containing protein
LPTPGGTFIVVERQEGGNHVFEVVKLCSAKAVGWPLYCMPTVAGSVDIYLDLARIIGQDRPVYGIAWRARASDREKFESVQELAASATAKLFYAPRLNGPIYLMGYSFGAHLAIEAARQLAEHSVAVPLVAIADQAPHGYSFSLGFRVRHFAETFGPWALRVATRYVTDATQRLSYRNATRLKLRGQHKFECESWYQRLPESRKIYTTQNLANSRKYRFEGVYSGKILLLRALQGKPVDPFRPSHLEDYGWGRVTGATVDVVSVPGDHASILQHPDVVYSGGAVRQALNDCDRNFASAVSRLD